MHKASFPEAFEKKVLSNLGPTKSALLLKNLDTEAPVSIRLNKQKLKGTKLAFQPVPWSDSGYWLSKRPLFISDPLWHAGYYYVQEASSMAIEVAFNKIIALQNGKSLDLVLDACAAPGGKSTHLLDMMSGNGLLISHEFLPKRASILAENLRRWGLNNSIVTQGELSGFVNSGLQFDLAVIDAPCSGEGMFRKDPKARLEWSESNVANCVLRQTKLIEQIWPTVKEGGFVIYSTCTFNRDENDLQLKALIEEGAATAIALPLQQFGFEADAMGIGYYAYPGQVQGEGFYLALLKKNKPLRNELSINQNATAQVKNSLLANLRYSEKVTADQSVEIYAQEGNQFANLGISHNYVPKTALFEKALSALKNTLQIKQVGLPVTNFESNRNTMIVDVSLAWALSINHSAHELSLTHVNFVKTLRGEAIHINSEKGYTNLKFGLNSVTFAKSIGSRMNSLQPKSLRIKKNIEQSSLFTIFDSMI